MQSIKIMLNYCLMKWNLYFFEKVGSTNDIAQNYPPFSVVIAKEQTAGRGRCGRVWLGAAGNLYMSIVLPDYKEKSPLIAFVMGVAAADAFKTFGACLKWPNDVRLNKQKLAGILLEHQEDKIIAGIGVNVAQIPTQPLPYQAASLNGVFTSAEAAQLLLERLSFYLALFETEGFEPIRQAWLGFAEGLNEEIEVKLPHETLRGRFVAMTPLGAIDLELKDKTHRLVTAGDVFLLHEGKRKNE